MELFLTQTLILLAIAILVTVFFRLFRFPAIVGYLSTGILFGPSGLGWLDDSQLIWRFTELGVVFLLFTVGLEFSFTKLVKMKKNILLGAMQVLFTVTLTVVLTLLLDVSSSQAIIIGCIVAMSSTAIVIKQLSEQMELSTKYGRNAIGVLLFQDLAAIPILMLIPMLAGVSTGHLNEILLQTFFKGFAAIVLIVVVGRWLLRPLFHEIAKLRSQELFTFMVLLIALGSAWLTELLNLSMVLGSFLAGMMLGETEFRHQIEADVRPFRDIMLAIFFIAMGMLFNIQALATTWPWVIVLTFSLIVLKCLLIAILAHFTGDEKSTAFRTGIVLAQGSEFGFAILSLAMRHTLLSPEYSQIVLSALLLSMLISPLLILNSKFIINTFVPKASRHSERVMLRTISSTARLLSNHIILCGYGRVGQNIARLLEQEGIAYLGIDLDPVLIQNAKLAGDKVTYGDCANYQILDAAGLSKAHAVVITFADSRATARILEHIQHHRPGMHVIVRAHDERDLKHLRNKPGVEIIPETLETSLTIAAHVLVLSGIPAHHILTRMHEIRSNQYALLHEVYSGKTWSMPSLLEEEEEQLYAMALRPDAFAVGRRLDELALGELRVLLKAVRRNGQKKLLEPGLSLESNDVLILYGNPSALERAEEYLLGGSY